MGAVSSPTDRQIAGRYRLRRQLGQGAMGTVWEAYDEFLRRPVAVKEVLLPPGIPDAEADELRERTLREARAIAALSHPNVITLHDVARENGEPFVVTEYLPAQSLAEVLGTLGPLATAAAAAVADAVAAGLAAAHQVGITHRDVKPGNVLVGTTPSTNGQVKLTDFGIARNVSERTMTRTGIMLGSPAYIAPEVAAGQEVTSAADLWGLGTTLFAMLEGHAPYDVNGTVLEIVNMVIHGEVPRPEAAGPLADIVAALMVKEPARRLSLAEVRNRLHPLLPPPTTPLLSDEDLATLADPDQTPTRLTPKPSAPPLPRPPATPAPAETPTGAPQLAPAPGPLPFDTTARRPPARRGRSRVVSALLVILAVVLFFAAAGGGFALARVVGGESVLPPERTSAPAPTPEPETSAPELVTQTGDAATVNGVQGGGYSVGVPRDWERFVEERVTDDLNSTRVYYVSTDGRRMLTVERFNGYFPGNSMDDYLDSLDDNDDVAVNLVEPTPTRGLPGGDPGVHLTYRTTTSGDSLAPGAHDLNRVTFANLLPLGEDLWVVGVTVPVDQEDTGRQELFDRIAKTFKVTG
ncbi:serine/threonine-protein kinase [Actinophytocola sp.]|uniref:serine/threonine-protein kinase n=1 Tax=Actinophytocola sp. TaxID=1872138 RepID=UPI003D6ACFE1